MRMSLALRRLALVAATASVLAGVPVTAAHAVDTISNVSPNVGANSNPLAVGFDLNEALLVAPEPTVKFVRTADPSDQIAIPEANVTVTGAHFDVTVDLTSRNPGAWDIKVSGKNASLTDVTKDCAGCFTVLAPFPTISNGVTTLGGGATGIPFTITGNNFTTDVYCSSGSCANEPTVSISGAGVTLGGSGANGAEVAATKTAITKTITVAPGAATGPRDIVVTNTDGKPATCAGCVVVAPTPTLTAVTPSGLAPGATGRSLVLTGTNFASGAAVAVTLPTASQTNNKVTLGTPVVDSPTQITVPITIADDATITIGDRNVTVTNTDKGTVTRVDLFDVNNKPTVSSVAYSDNAPTTSSYGRGALNRTLEISGNHFQNGATVAFGKPTGITVDSTTVVDIDTIQVDVTLNQVDASPPDLGPHAITVTNPDGGVSGSASSLTVSEGPKVTGVSPASRGRGETSDITISGTGFSVAGVTVTIPDVTVNSYSNLTTTSVTANITVGNGLNIAGPRDVTLMNNSDKGRFVCDDCFAIANLQVNSISPSSALNDSTQSFTISGSGFSSGAVASLVKTGSGAGMPDITGTTTSVNVAGTQMTVSFPLSGAAAGPWLVRVTNDGSNPGSATCTCTLTVVAAGPSVTSVTPDDRGSGAQDEVLTIAGSGFLAGAQVTFSNPGVHVVGTPVVTPTEITVTVDIDPNSQRDPLAVPQPPADTLTVTNTDGQNDSTPFTVNAGPTATSLGSNDGQRAQGTTATVTLTGTELAEGAKLIFGGTGVTAGATTFTAGNGVTTSDTLSALVTVAADAAPGARTVSVRNPDGGFDQCTCTLTVNVPPTVTTITPAKVAKGATTVVTINGTGFLNTATVQPIQGITTTVTNRTPTALTVSFNVDAAAALGDRNVTVDNGDGGTATKTNGVEVITVPGAPTDATATRGNTAATVSWTAPSTDGGDPITSYTVTSNPGGKTKTTIDGQTTTAVVEGLTNGTSYTFTVVATNAAGNSAASAPTAAVTPATVPDAPTAVTATAGAGQATVQWAAPASNGGSGITGYTVTSSPGGKTADVNGSTTQAVVDGLTNGTKYTFTVVAKNDVGTSPTSLPSNEVTPMSVPDAPTSVSATPQDKAALVSWTAPESDGGSPITGYTVTSSPGGHTAVAGGDETSATVNGLTNGTAYTFTVTAANAKGTSPASAPSDAVTPAAVPDAPTGVTATGGDGKATVSWTAPASNNGSAITGYVVTATPGNVTKNVDGSTLSTDVTGLTNGTAYTFTVAAKNAAGTGAASAPSNSVTPAGVPGTPTGVFATPGHGAATVGWTAPGGNGSPITSYTVTATPGGVSKVVTGTSTTFTGLTNGVSYTFAVKATNAVGSGAAGTSNAVVPTWVTALSESATKAITAGSTATVTGKLTRSNGTGVVGAPIKIYRRVAPATTYTYVRTVTTGTGGVWKTSFTLSKNTYFQAKFAGSNGLDPATSAARLTKVAYKVVANYKVVGRTVTVSGAIWPNAAGRTVYLRYRRADGSVGELKTAKVASNGTYRMSRTLSRGTYALYVYIGASSTNVGGRSPYRSTRIT